jgi:Domain of unknown function (DUF4265)
MSENLNDRVKIAFRLKRDADDYPPADWEHLWAIPCGDDTYELDNIPFFATGVSSADVVTVHRNGDQLVFDRVARLGGHSTIRIVMYDNTETEVIRGWLAKLGCQTEGSHLPGLFAVDVPSAIDYSGVREYLKLKASEGVLDYEESAIQH